MEQFTTSYVNIATQGGKNMKEQLKVVEMCYQDLLNTLKVFKDNEYAINSQIDILIFTLKQLKIK